MHHSEFEVLNVEFMKACWILFPNTLMFLHCQLFLHKRGSLYLVQKDPSKSMKRTHEEKCFKLKLEACYQVSKHLYMYTVSLMFTPVTNLLLYG